MSSRKKEIEKYKLRKAKEGNKCVGKTDRGREFIFVYRRERKHVDTKRRSRQ